MLNGFFKAILTILLILSCSPGPRRTLTIDEKIADLNWVFSKFDQNYAPREMKEKIHNFNYEEIKTKYLKEAKETQSNDEFYHLMLKFIAEFKDAHTSGSIQVSSLPGRTKYAYLGFTGKRVGNAYIVKKLLPTITKDSHYPIQVEDKVTKINGIDLISYFNENIKPYRNLGQDQANYTNLFGALFNRSSYAFPLPTQKEVTLTVERSDKEYEITLPWAIKDLVEFREEQKEAVKKAMAKTHSNYSLDISEEDFSKIESLITFQSFKAISFDQILTLLKTEKDFDKIFQTAIENLKDFNIQETFAYEKQYGAWDIVELLNAYLVPQFSEDEEDNHLKGIEETVDLIGKPYHVKGSKVFPAYITHIEKDNQRIRLGYIKIHSFSPGGATEKEIIKEVKNTLNIFKDFDITNIVIDLLDNGGGSLSLGTSLAQTFTHKKIEIPSIQFKVNETWLDNFENKSVKAESDFEREIARRTFEQLLNNLNKGTILSQAFGIKKSLYPFVINPNEDLYKKDNKTPYEFKIAALINESCASMCDIFAAILKDNKMATLIGSQTMGAGGNVTTHAQAPNSNLILRQTESLIVRSREQKDYLENAGVKPDLEVKTYEEMGNYSGVIEKVVEFFKEK